MAVDLATLAIRVDALEVAAAEKKLDDLSASGARAEKSTASVTSAFKALKATMAAVAIAETVRQLVATADAYTRVEGRVKLLTSSTSDLYQVQNSLYAIAQRSRAEYLATADVYARFAGAVKGQNVAQEELLTITETLNKAFVISGASQQEASTTMVQLSQAFGSGVLRGDEFNSVMEQGGRVIDLLTAYTGKSRGELRKMAEQGQITSDVMRNAIVSGASQVNAEFGKMPMTVGQASTLLANALGSLVSGADKATGATGSLASAIAGLASTIDANRSGILSFFQNLGSIANPAFSGAELMAEAAAQGVEKLERVATSKVPGIKAAMNELEAEISRVNESMALRTSRGADTNAEAESLRQLNHQLDQQKKTLKDLTSSPYITGEAAGKLNIAAQAWGGIEFKMKGVRNETAAEREISDKAHAASIKYAETREQIIEREYKAAYAGARTESERAAVIAKHEKELKDLADQRGKSGESAHKKAAAAAEKHATELQHLIDKYLPLRGAAETVAEAEKGLAELRQKGAISADDYAMAIQHVREEHYAEIEAATHAIELQTQLADAYGEVTRALMTDQQRKVYDIQDANSKLIAQIDLLEQERKITGQLASTWRSKLGEKMAQDIQAVNEEASQSSKLFEDMAKNIQSAFSGMFESLIDGTGNMLDDLGTLFKKLLAQMATMAIAQPIIVPIVYSMGSAMGISDNTIAKSLGMDVSGLSGIGGLGSMFSSGSLQSMGVSALSGIGSGLQYLGLNTVGNAFMSGGEWLNGLSGVLGDSLTAGAGSLLMSALSGKLNSTSIFQAGGAALGSAFGPIGSIAGGFLGNLVGGLFGNDDPPHFGIDSGILRAANTSYSRDSGFINPTATTYDPNFNETAQTIHPIFSAYSSAIVSIQKNFNSEVSQLSTALPEMVRDRFLDNLASTDFASILSSASSGTWLVSDAEEAIQTISDQYATSLTEQMGKAYGTAIQNYLASNGASGLVGSETVWSMLTDSVQQNITSSFTSAAATISSGDYETGLSKIQSVQSAISSIASAMVPIDEIIQTDGMTEYEKAIRSVNQQFDGYRDALKAAGVDLSKYTDLEKARSIALREAAQSVGGFSSVLSDLAEEANSALSVAEQNLRSAYSAEQERLAVQHESVLSGLNDQLEMAQDSVSNLTSLTGSLRNALDGMRLESDAFTRDRRKGAQATLQATLAAARNGQLDPSVDLGDTLNVLSESSTGLFATFEEYQKDFWTTYLAVAELEQLSGNQLSEAERTVDLLERQIEAENTWYKTEQDLLTQQLNAILGLNTAIMSIGQATAQYQQAQAAAQAAAAQVSSASSGSGISEDSYFAEKVAQLTAAGVMGTVYQGVKLNTVEDVKQVFANNGLTVQSHWELYGQYEGLDKPSFAVGTDYVPYDMVAKIHQGERITPAAYNRSDVTNAQLVEAINSLRAELRAQNGEIAKNTSKTAKLLDAWDGDGMPEQRVIA